MIDLKKEGKAKKQDEENVAEAYLTPAKTKKGGKKLSKTDDQQSSSASDSKLVTDKKVRKAFKDEEDDVAEDISDSKK